MTEEWKSICGYEGRYQVSNLGRVKSLPHKDQFGRLLGGKILRPINAGNGYLRVHLSKGQSRRLASVHHLVAEAFVPNPSCYPIINHKDENRSNNRADNLEWCTYKYNNNYGKRNQKSGEKHRGEKCFFHKLSEHEVRLLKREHPFNHCSNQRAAELAEKYGVSTSTIKNIVHARTWAWVK